ncbi:MAG: glycosyltransferase family 2 protein [Anaerolineae bacterium]
MNISTQVEPDAPLASVIIPNWNGIKLLRPCLDSLRKQTLANYEIIVVDNGSSDGSVQALNTEYPEVRTLALAKNGGYTGGCNAGIGAARGRYLVLLNNDTEADTQWLENLIDGLHRYPDAGMATSRIMLYDQRYILNSAGDQYGRDGLPNSRGVWQAYDPGFASECFVFGGSGGAVALRREMLVEIGLFEEAFFMWCEDVDLAWRAQLAGWKCVYEPEAVIYHRLSATGGGKLASFYVGRNTIWVIARNFPPSLYKRYWSKIWLAQWRIAWSAFCSWRGEAARARLRGQLTGLFTLGRWRQFRKSNIQGRRVSDDYLESILS